MTIWSSNSTGCPSGPSTGAAALRFFGFGGPPLTDAAGDGTEGSVSWSSGAFLLLLGFAGTLDVEPTILRGEDAADTVERAGASLGAI